MTVAVSTTNETSSFFNPIMRTMGHFSAMRDTGELELRAAISLLLTGDISSARQFVAQVLSSGVDRRQAAQLMLGAAYISLGRAALVADSFDRGVRHLAMGLRLGAPTDPSLFLELLISEADRCLLQHKGKEAVQRWQDVACLLGENCPDYVYQQLGVAYSQNKEGFGGTKEENHCWGDCHKHELLGLLHECLMPELYLEIGLDAGLSLARARGRAIGVDPRSDLVFKISFAESASIFSMSSDAFFRELAMRSLRPRPELVFIDGMHLFEFALRDFLNVERFAAPTTLVVIDDIYPCHRTQALRRRRSGAWAGDIWKLHRILRETRPDLTLVALNAYTTGVLLIAGLDPDNQDLKRRYNQSVSQYLDIDDVPPEVIARHGAIPSDHPLVGQLVDILREGKEHGLSGAQVRSRLSELKKKIAEVEAEFVGRAESMAVPFN